MQGFTEGIIPPDRRHSRLVRGTATASVLPAWTQDLRHPQQAPWRRLKAGGCGLFKRRGRFARRKLGQALVPAKASGLPSIFLGEMPKAERKLPPVYLCEAGPDG